MIKDGFLYLAALIFAAAILVNLPKIFKGKKAQVFFNFAPPIVLIYLGLMLLCTLKVWDLSATSAVYKSVKNPVLYAMLFLMLLRCDLKKIAKLGPKMLIGFFAATLSIGLGFVVSYAIFHQWLGEGSWKALGALCGSWMGGGISRFSKEPVNSLENRSPVSNRTPRLRRERSPRVLSPPIREKAVGSRAKAARPAAARYPPSRRPQEISTARPRRRGDRGWITASRKRKYKAEKRHIIYAM